MHWRIMFSGIFVVGLCLMLTGCPDKTTPEPSVGVPDSGQTNQKQTLTLLDKIQGTYEENAVGAVVAVNLKISDVADQASQDELFDAVNKLVDLEKMSFDGPGIDDNAILRLTGLKKIKTANFKNTNITTKSLTMMAETMPDLTNLSLNRCMNLDADSLAVVAREMPKLKVLDLQSNAFKTFDIRVLTSLPELEQLDLRQCIRIEGEALKSLSQIATLKVLRLRGTEASFRDRDIESLAGHPALKAFFLQDANVSDDFLDPLMKIPTLIDLSMFRLLDISNDGLEKLKDSKLQRLFIRENVLIDDEGIALVKSMPDLNKLILYEVRAVTDNGLIAAISGNTKLINLALYDMESITDKSCEALETTVGMRSLELRKTGQTDVTLKTASRLPRLESIIIGNNSKFTDEGLACLGESKSLKTIEIKDSTSITDAAITEFRTKYPTIALVISATGQHE